MKLIYIYCEGQTEEAFVNNLLTPYFSGSEYFLIPITATTSRSPSGEKEKGGVAKYSKIIKDLQQLCGEHKNEYVTTLLDFYGLPLGDFSLDKTKTLYEQVKLVERKIEEDVGFLNLHCQLLVHEFEALLFTDLDAVLSITGETQGVEYLFADTREYPNPEHINNSKETAPSKRLLAQIPRYAKLRMGIPIAKEIGIDRMRKNCPHFAEWFLFKLLK